MAKAKWLKKQTSELLPTGYFHLVFTLTHELNRLVLAHKRVLLNILFQAVSETLLEFGHTHLRGTVGFIAVLHTWDQLLKDHFHLHCLIPAGALSSDQSRWVKARKNFLFRVEPLSRVFRGKFLYLMRKAIRQGKLPSPTPRLSNTDWVVYAKKPFASPQQVLDYLGRYTHRVAISNNRILCAKDGQVTFTYRDRSDEDRLKTKTLDAQEFIRRFLLHVLPDGFMRIRHFGFLANRTKKQALPRCRELLGLPPALPELPNKSTQDLMRELTGTDISRCPRCKQGTMVIVAELPKVRPWDSS
jgi:hypothetical protein